MPDDSWYDFATPVEGDVALEARYVVGVAQVGWLACGDGSVSAVYDSSRTAAVGIVIAVADGAAAKIAALEESSGQWSTESRTTGCAASDGKENMDKIKQLDPMLEKYPAFKYCDDYADASGNGEWYLPSGDEFDLVYQAKDKVNAAIRKIGGSTAVLGGGSYWSSSQDSSSGLVGQSYAWRRDFSSGQWYSNIKNLFLIRAIHSF